MLVFFFHVFPVTYCRVSTCFNHPRWCRISPFCLKCGFQMVVGVKAPCDVLPSTASLSDSMSKNLDPFSAFPTISTQKNRFFQMFKNPLVSCGSWICRSPPLWIAPSSSARALDGDDPRPWTATTRGTRP